MEFCSRWSFVLGGALRVHNDLESRLTKLTPTEYLTRPHQMRKSDEIHHYLSEEYFCLCLSFYILCSIFCNNFMFLSFAQGLCFRALHKACVLCFVNDPCSMFCKGPKFLSFTQRLCFMVCKVSCVLELCIGSMILSFAKYLCFMLCKGFMLKFCIESML